MQLIYFLVFLYHQYSIFTMSHIDPDKLKAISQQLNLTGEDLLEFITSENALSRDERARERSLERLKIEQSNSAAAAPVSEPNINKLKLLPYNEGDDLSAYLTRFERISVVYKWDNFRKAIQLGSLLQDKALQIYSTFDDETTNDYDKLKQALLNSYKLNDEHYRKEFRNGRIKSDSTFQQFGIDLCRKFDSWVKSTGVEKNYDCLRNFVISDQFMSAIPPEVRTFIKEQQPACTSVAEITKIADTYGNAHPHVYKTPNVQRDKISRPKDAQTRVDGAMGNPPRIDPRVKCYSCGEFGHKKPSCPRNPKVHKVSHNQYKHIAPGPMYSGTANGIRVSTILYDTGCSCVMVHNDIVPDADVSECQLTCSDYLGRNDTFPVVDLYLKCDLFEGWVKAVRAPLKHCSVLLGDVDWHKKNDDGNYVSPTVEKRSLKFDNSVHAVSTRSSARRVIHPLVLPEIEPLKVSKGNFSEMQKNCATLIKIREKLDSGESYKSRSNREFKFVLHNDLIYRQCTLSPVTTEVGKRVLVVPSPCRKLVLKTAHDIPVAGHFSNRRTENKVCDKFWWPGVSSDVRQYCRSCDACQRTAARGRTRPVAMTTMPIISTPFERIAIDLVGPLSPPTSQGHRFILTMIDYATSFIEAVPLKDITSISVAESLMEVFSRVGIPREVISDRGTQFTSDMMGQIHKLVGIKPIFTTAYHPQMNGKLERQHATMKSVLKKLCSEKPKDWNRYLIPTLFAMREIPSETTGFSPFELLYGRQVRGPLAILHDLWSEPELDDELRTSYEYVVQLRDRLEDTAQLAAENSKLKLQSYKTYFDKKTVKRTFKVGDEVLLLLPDSSNKLLSTWKGPYPVVEVRSKLNYVIDVNGTTKLFHVNLLKRYFRRANVNCMYLVDEISTLEHFGINNEHAVQTCVIENDDDSTLGAIPTVCYTGVSSDVNINPKLDVREVNTLADLIQSYDHVLSDLPGCTPTLTHKIQLKTTDVVCNRNYPVPIHLKKHFDEEVERMLEMGIITPSKSNFCSPSVMVAKQGTDPKTYRVTQDFRALNAISRFDAEPMPSIEADLHKFSGAKYISEIDITRAYYQIPLDESSRKYTAFATSKGLMEYVRLPFGLVTACATYTRLMRKVFSDLPAEADECIIIYFDNIYIATPTFELHVKLLELVFQRLSEHGLTARPSKCNLAYPEIQYLGFKVGNNSLAPLSSNINAVIEMPLPTNKKQLRSFLGMLSFYRMCIPNMASMTSPLSDMLKIDFKEPLLWDDVCSANFQKLKQCMISPPILKIPDLSKPFC